MGWNDSVQVDHIPDERMKRNVKTNPLGFLIDSNVHIWIKNQPTI